MSKYMGSSSRKKDEDKVEGTAQLLAGQGKQQLLAQWMCRHEKIHAVHPLQF